MASFISLFLLIVSIALVSYDIYHESHTTENNNSSTSLSSNPEWKQLQNQLRIINHYSTQIEELQEDDQIPETVEDNVQSLFLQNQLVAQQLNSSIPDLIARWESYMDSSLQDIQAELDTITLLKEEEDDDITDDDDDDDITDDDDDHSLTPKHHLPDPLMGTRSNSNCPAGPQRPSGSVQPSPQTLKGSHGGYRPGNSVAGFSQLHVSGTGWGSYGQLLLSPQTGSAVITSHTEAASTISGEDARAYGYQVLLDKYDTKVELTPTDHCAMYRFTYPSKKNNYLWLNLDYSVPSHQVKAIGGGHQGTEASYDKATYTLSGTGRYSGGFGYQGSYTIHWALTFEEDPTSVEKVTSPRGYKIAFGTEKAVRQVKISVSFSAQQKAIGYLATELPDWNFEGALDSAAAAWDAVLGRIDVQMESEEMERVFYTSLYHSWLMPRNRTGDLHKHLGPASDTSTPLWDDQYSIWDTFRTVYPLHTLINPDMVVSAIGSFRHRLSKGMRVGTQFCKGQEWNSQQGGDDVDVILADAVSKRVPGLDLQAAYDVAKHHFNSGRVSAYRQLGWLPSDASAKSGSDGVEFAYNDACVGLIAEAYGDAELASKAYARSNSWTQLWDDTSCKDGHCGFIMTRTRAGSFNRIDPGKYCGSWPIKHHYEATAWTSSLFVPHDFPELIERAGGDDKFVDRVITGIEKGYLSIDNEPGFLVPFSLIYAGAADAASELVDALLRSEFSLTEGYPGNEDSGSMGSWFVFCSLGLFPNAGQPVYLLTAPKVVRAVVTLPGHGTLEIVSNASPDNVYLKQVLIDNKDIGDRAWLTHSELVQASRLEYVLTDKPLGYGSVRPPMFMTGTDDE
eukprot:gnl/Dysnectes_brevis/3727_a4778_955.p1 GENE.gnl/Dysnectes_brevis/3727_a4778_955~~gnl/Dysnectes_brevis/3727_a4778_955.p1  ORF type:complete len:849 (+),score=127.39 gnl/Dysnectes_brevis/3727_a4778_955:74-2620(+)